MLTFDIYIFLLTEVQATCPCMCRAYRIDLHYKNIWTVEMFMDLNMQLFTYIPI